MIKYWLLVTISLPLVVLAKPGDTDKQAYCASLVAKGMVGNTAESLPLSCNCSTQR